jgi:hypothetical protein
MVSGGADVSDGPNRVCVYVYSDCDDCRQLAVPDCQRNGDLQPDAYSQPYAVRNSDPNSHATADPDSYIHAHIDTDTDVYADDNVHAYSNGHGHTHIHTHCDSNPVSCIRYIGKTHSRGLRNRNQSDLGNEQL